ncbi:MAG: hypothetical protein J6Q51_03130 [Clostridia bacterium]|nr:hypothetical protein [Clostridia bacterium]
MPPVSDKDDRAVGIDAIGQNIKLTTEINEEFDENDLIDADLVIEPSEKKNGRKAIAYHLMTKNAGFNCLCELNLGKAFVYSCEKDEEGNIISETRRQYDSEKDPDYEQAMNETWFDYTLEQIKNATNPVVVISDIFSKVTVGNKFQTLPYKEQLHYIYKKLNDDKIKSKIVALVRGVKEKEIINTRNAHVDHGPDLMLKLAKMLGLEDRLVDSGFAMNVGLNNKTKSNISMLHVDKKITSVSGLAKTMAAFEQKNPGKDIYFCTNSKINWYSCGTTTTVDEKGNTVRKPCWFISFGPMYEYDKTNAKRTELGPYTLNKGWYKLSIDEHNFVRTDSVDYTFPQPSKIDSSNYVASVLSQYEADKFRELYEQGTEKFFKELERLSDLTRKQLVTTLHDADEVAKKYETPKTKGKTVPALRQVEEDTSTKIQDDYDPNDVELNDETNRMLAKKENKGREV